MKATLHQRFFFRYFADSCCFTRDAYEFPKPTLAVDAERRRMYVRAAIINSALALEAAANACLDGLNLQEGTNREFERLQTLSKFEVFLQRVTPGKSIDRQHPLVRPIANLISCRNTYVHSKVLIEEVEDQRLLTKRWEPLGLPKNQVYWQPLHAVKVLTVTSDFLNHFFFELCPGDYANPSHRGNVATLLGSVIAADEGSTLQNDIRAAPIRDNEP